MALQLCVPAGMIGFNHAYKALAERYGSLCKFPVSTVVYTGDYGGEVEPSLSFDIAMPGNSSDYDFFTETGELESAKPYAVISTGSDGFAVMSLTEERPDTDTYVKSIENLYSFEFPANTMEIKGPTYKNSVSFAQGDAEYSRRFWGPLLYLFDEAYLEAYVYKGRVYVKEIYVDGVAIESKLAEVMEKPEFPS
jgi:hypothetical protein